MPVFTFRCKECEFDERKLVKSGALEPRCKTCGGELEKQLPTDLSSETLEMRDKYRGVQLPKNQGRRVRKRMKEHEEKYERAEKIDKQGLEASERMGWVKKKK